MAQKKVKKTRQTRNVDVKTSTQNILLNAVLFLLLATIIYLVYSIVIQFNEKPVEEIEKDKHQTASEIIQVEVRNGCGIPGLAERFTDYLRNEGIDVVDMGNYISFDIDKSIVIDRTGNKANAFKVAKVLGIDEANVFTEKNEDYFLDVSVVVGRDYYKLKPVMEGD